MSEDLTRQALRLSRRRASRALRSRSYTGHAAITGRGSDSETSSASASAQSHRLEELLPQAERVEVPGASHLKHEENAAAYNAAAQFFLARPRRAT